MFVSKASVLVALMFVAPPVVGQASLTVTPCENPGKGVLKSVTAEPCTSNPCTFKKGSKVKFSFVFLAAENTTSAYLDSRASIFGIKIPIPGLESNMCKKAIRCPVQRGQVVKGSFSLYIFRIPLSSSTIQVRIYDDEGLTSCFTFPVTFK